MGTKLSINGITFGDASVQNTAATTGVTSLTAGSGISVSGATGAVTVSATGGGTVTSVATGNGLSGGTINSTGTLSIASPDFNTVGSYCYGRFKALGGGAASTITSGRNYSVGTGTLQINSARPFKGGAVGNNNLSGSWKYMGGTDTNNDACSGDVWVDSLFCRVS